MSSSMNWSFERRQKSSFPNIESVKSSYSSSVLAKACIKQRKPITDMMKNSDPNGIELMNLFLQFNPHKRITVEEALRHVYVKRFHNPVEEIRVSRPVLPPVSDNVQLSVSEYRNRLYQLIGEKISEKSRRSKQSRTPSFDNVPQKTDSFKRPTAIYNNVGAEMTKPVAAQVAARLDGTDQPITPSSPTAEKKSDGLVSSQTIEVSVDRVTTQNTAVHSHIDGNREKSLHRKHSHPQHHNSVKHLPSATSDYFSGQSRDVSAMWSEKEASQKEDLSTKTRPISTSFFQISESDERQRNSTIFKVEESIDGEKNSKNNEILPEEVTGRHPNISPAKSVRSQSISRCHSVACSNGNSTVSTPTRKLSPNLATTISETIGSKSTNSFRMGPALSPKESTAVVHPSTSTKQLSSVLLPNNLTANSYLSVYSKRTCPILSANRDVLLPTFVHQHPVNGDAQLNHTSAVRTEKPGSSNSHLEKTNTNRFGSYTTVYLDNTQFKTVGPPRKRSVLFPKRMNEYHNLERSDVGPPPTTSDYENDLNKIICDVNKASILKDLPTRSASLSAVSKRADEQAPYVFVSSVHREHEVAAYSSYLRAASNSQKPSNMTTDAERHANSMHNLQICDGIFQNSLNQAQLVSQHTPLRVPQSSTDIASIRGDRQQASRGNRNPPSRYAAVATGETTAAVTAKSTQPARSHLQPGRIVMNQKGLYPSLKPNNLSYCMPLANHKRTLNRRILNYHASPPEKPPAPAHLVGKR